MSSFEHRQPLSELRFIDPRPLKSIPIDGLYNRSFDSLRCPGPAAAGDAAEAGALVEAALGNPDGVESLDLQVYGDHLRESGDLAPEKVIMQGEANGNCCHRLPEQPQKSKPWWPSRLPSIV